MSPKDSTPPGIIPQDPPPPPPSEIQAPKDDDDLPETHRKKPPKESPKHSSSGKKRRHTPMGVEIIKNRGPKLMTSGWGNMIRGACVLIDSESLPGK